MGIQVRNHSILVSRMKGKRNDSLMSVYVEKVFYGRVRDILSIIRQTVVTNRRQILYVYHLFLVD